MKKPSIVGDRRCCSEGSVTESARSGVVALHSSTAPSARKEELCSIGLS